MRCLGAARILEQPVRLSESPQGMATELGPAPLRPPSPHAKAVTGRVQSDGQG